jgi:serine/threonine-protein kinase
MSTPEPMIGQTIDGRYRVLRVLGQGGMGAVYDAEHTGTGRRVAVKVIHADMATKSEMVLRFQREARAAGSIETPHIVHVFDTGTDPETGVVYMAMELLRGEDLQQLIKRLGRLPPRLALKLVGQACLGLGAAHATGVIHRDIKPANLFLSYAPDGPVTVKVVDFGIAKIMVEPGDGEEAALTRTGGMLGSPLYMSPEQATGRKTIDHRTDIWSLGVVLYQALAGRVPHRAESLGALIMAICSEAIPPLQNDAPWVPPEVADLVHRTLLRDPAARPADTEALRRAIQELVPGPLTVHASELLPLTEGEAAQVAPRAALAGGIVTGQNTIPSLSADTGLAAATGATGLSVSQGSAAPRRSRIVPALAAVVALGGAAGAYTLLGGRKPPVVVTAVTTAVSAAPTLAPAVEARPEERVVRLSVEPADAAAEVDGQAAAVRDGAVEIRGAVGSAHRVRLVKGADQVTVEVAIATLGPIPPKVQLTLTDPRAAPATPGGKVPGARPGATARPSSKTRDPALDGKFE